MAFVNEAVPVLKQGYVCFGNESGDYYAHYSWVEVRRDGCEIQHFTIVKEAVNMAIYIDENEQE